MIFKIASMVLLLYMAPLTTEVFSQSPTVQLVDVRQMDNDQHIFITLDYQGETYEWGVDISLGIDAATHIAANTDRYMSDIYRKMYRKAPNILHSIAQWEAWISDGHKIQVKDGFDEQGKQKWKVIEKKEFKGKHPKSIQLRKDLNAATSLPERITIIEDYLLME